MFPSSGSEFTVNTSRQFLVCLLLVLLKGCGPTNRNTGNGCHVTAGQLTKTRKNTLSLQFTNEP